MGELVYLWGRNHTLPPLITTVDLLNLCDQPIVSALCATPVRRAGSEQPCGGLLAYQNGAWHHVNACRDCFDTPQPCPGNLGHVSCPAPDPQVCMHRGCPEPADPVMQCTGGASGECDGCCWVLDDHLQGRPMWTR